MTIVWKIRWNTGLEAIDRQHHSIAEHINKLGAAIPSAKTSQPESHDHDADEYAHYAFLF